MTNSIIEAHKRANKKLEDFLDKICKAVDSKEPWDIDFVLHECYHHLKVSQYLLKRLEQNNE